MPVKTSPFESTTCTRCDGTGRHAFNYLHGSVCYGCSGRGYILTKRGQVARDHFTASCSVRADQLEPGMTIWESGSMFSTAGWTPVVSVERFDRNPDLIIVKTEKCSHSTRPDKMMRLAQSAEDKAAKLAEALALQESLTKSGTPRKRTRGIAS